MLDEIFDHEPAQNRFARFLNSRLDPKDVETLTRRWASHWHEREGPWANMRDLVHWIDRSREAR
jgi:hypothetical protein